MMVDSCLNNDLTKRIMKCLRLVLVEQSSQRSKNKRLTGIIYGYYSIFLQKNTAWPFIRTVLVRAGRSTTEQIFNLRILCEKYLQHQQNPYHVFIDFKKAFDRVWHAALWATMRKYNISANLVRTIEQLYDKATSAVQLNGSIGEWFRTTVGVRQGCLLSPTLFNIFLERIMSDALEEHDVKVSIGGRNITNLRFADDIDAQAEEERELEALVESLDKTCTRYKMEISAEKTKLTTNSANSIHKRTEVGHCNKLQVPWSSCFRLWLQTRGSLKDCTSHCSFYKAEAHLER